MGDSRKKVAPRTKTEDKGTWMWISFASESRLIIDFIIGPRKRHVADELIEATYKHLSDSKKVKGLYNQMRFYCTHFNFCRDHRGLTKEKGIWEKENTCRRMWNY